MKDREKATVWITKYALNAGIKQIEVTITDTGMAYAGYNYYHGEGREWHRTLEPAIAKAEQMRKAKIASLEKQLAKLKALNFTPEHLTLE